MQGVGLKSGIVAALFVASIAYVADFAEAQQVGTAAAVNPAAQARGSGGSRTIIIGQSIAHRERIQTTAAGSVQLLFLDKTSMTIGPNSDLAIDEYVYDPASNTGKLAATLSKGVMRFVGGQISHAGNAQVTTPNAVVGIRGGVAIFNQFSIYMGYGEGNVRSGSSSVTLAAGDYTQTLGGGAPPTNPGPPPSGFLQSVLAALQSQAGQGGGARASTGQVNQARTVATGSSTGNIATTVQNVVNQTVNTTTQNVLSLVNQTVQTTANQARVPEQQQDTPGDTPHPQYLTGFTGGLVFTRNNYGPFGPIIAALGAGYVQTNTQDQNDLAAFATTRLGAVATGAYNPYANSSDEFQTAFHQFGPNSANVQIDDLANGASVLLPTTNPNGTLAATVNSQAVSQFNGGFVEFRPGSAISQAASQTVGVAFCQCEYTRWGLWAGETTRPQSNVNGGPIKDSAEMFWVAGRMPANAGDIPTTGSATYAGHAIANIQNNGNSYVSAGQFQNTVNFGSQTGTVSITNLDGSNYAGQVMFGSGSPVFAGTLTAPNRSMDLIGSFFQGRTSPVGEMGGGLRISGPSNYGGAGIFAGRRQ